MGWMTIEKATDHEFEYPDVGRIVEQSAIEWGVPPYTDLDQLVDMIHTHTAAAVRSVLVLAFARRALLYLPVMLLLFAMLHLDRRSRFKDFWRSASRSSAIGRI
jgi:hypothetical protein